MIREKHELAKRWKRRRLAMTVIAARLGRPTPFPPKERLVTLGACQGNHTSVYKAHAFARLRPFVMRCILRSVYRGWKTSFGLTVYRHRTMASSCVILYSVSSTCALRALQARENSFEELKRELLNTYGSEKSFVELIKRIHPLRQRESQIVKQCAEVVAKLGRRACVSDRDLVALLAGGVASREVHRAIRLRDPPTLPEAHKGAEKERRQPHTCVMKQEKDDDTQHLEAL
ncbi:hypothetical protein T09_14987 [Trichinella sp. T9]|nr:hypothetical protein T09_14987 [Trichinella sp. T9]